MSACWKENPSERKKFVDIANQLNFDLREYKVIHTYNLYLYTMLIQSYKLVGSCAKNYK